jgi:nicotinamide-nucleotide amidase
VSGRTLDINAWYAAGRLTAAGLHVSRITSVGDDHRKVTEALKKALRDSRFVLVTGGLGSTDDDLTNEIVASALNRPLCLDENMLRLIEKHAAVRGIKITASLKKMAWMPDGSRLLNPAGTACGFCIEERGVRLYFLPGVPDQMRYLMDKLVIPELIGTFRPLPVMRQRIVKLYGLNEPNIAEIFKDLHHAGGDVVLGFYPHFPENHITISLRGENEKSVTQELERVEQAIERLVGPYVFAKGIENMEEVVGRKLSDRRLTISVAESCTGGLIGHRLTNVPGSSVYFRGGVAVYSNQAKMNLLHVDPKIIDRYGAVSDATVRAMATSVRDVFQTELSLAVTGIAGPSGGSTDKPVGTVHVALAAIDNVFSKKYVFWGNREQIKLNTSMMALDWVRRYLDGHPFLPSI